MIHPPSDFGPTADSGLRTRSAQSPCRQSPRRFVLIFGLAIAAMAWQSGSATAQPQGNRTRGRVPAKPAPVAAPVAPEVDLEALPPGFVPPRDVRKEFSTDEEWNFNPYKSDKEQRQAEGKYSSLRITGAFVDPPKDKKLIDDLVKYKLAQMTLKENRENVHRLREKMLGEIRQAGVAKQQAVRDYILRRIVEDAPQLFKYHFVARINGALLLTELDEADVNGGGPHVPAFDPLLKLLRDQSQLEALRLVAVKGLSRIAAVKELKGEIKQPIIQELVDQMNNSGKSHFYYQMRLAEALGQLNAIYDRNKRPIVVQALAVVLADPQRPWIVRCEAAMALGRLPLDGSIDIGAIAIKIAELAEQMGADYLKNPNEGNWKSCFFRLYLTFKPLTPGQGLLAQVQNKAAVKKTVQEAYDRILPLIQSVLKGASAGIAPALGNLTTWLKANKQKDFRISNDMPSIGITSGIAVPAGQVGEVGMNKAPVGK